ncbi:MAG TPA: Flp pilus assembly protein CpaB [Alphaproteobacteria bacterium]|nr:Flp pilus assembly protein CpaB [Alphaproteobacteria bacterium]
MRSRALIFALFALLFAVGTAMIVRSRLSDARQQVAEGTTPDAAAKTYVLVAANDLASGEIVHDPDLRWQSWPDGEIGDGYLVKDRDKMDAISGGVVTRHIAKGQPVAVGEIIQPGERGYLAAVLGPGMRAVTVPVTVASGVAGLLIPGDRVDLILSHPIVDERTPNAPARLVGETVLTDVRVVAIDQEINDQDKKAIAGKSATLEVNPKQAEAVEVAKQLGNLSLSLRSVGKDSAPAEPGVSHTWDSDVSPLIQHLHANPGAPTKADGTVVILRGGGSGGGSSSGSGSAGSSGGGNAGAAANSARTANAASMAASAASLGQMMR